MKNRDSVLTSTGRFFRCSGLTLSGPVCTYLYRRNGMLDFRMEDIGNDISILRNLDCWAGGRVSQKIQAEVVNNPLHCLFGRWDRSIRTLEGSHLGLVVGEGQVSVANTFPCFCHIGQHCCSSLLEVFLYRVSAQLCELRRYLVVA